MTTKAHTAQRFLVNTLPRALALEETSADSHTKVRVPSPAARATKARSRAVRGIGARSVGKSRIRHTGQNDVQKILPLLRRLCSRQLRFHRHSEVAPLGLSTPVNSSANSENVVALAAIFERCLVSRWIF